LRKEGSYVANTTKNNGIGRVEVAGSFETFNGCLVFPGLELYRTETVPDSVSTVYNISNQA